MNSFNHYAYGAIGDWLYQSVAGIRLDESEPAYKKIRIQPQPGEGLDWVEGKLDSMYGMIRSYWRQKDGVLEMEVTIPPNTTAEIVLPGAGDPEAVRESGTSLKDAKGIADISMETDGIRVSAGSGTYRFKYGYQKN